ncbi:hypothetical protein C0991_007095 [Blastosporella zonata]|nr:hypothetical protein C0991_007095 [Blastosporella zonata]
MSMSIPTDSPATAEHFIYVTQVYFCAVLLIRTYAFFNRNVYILLSLLSALSGVIAYQLYVDATQMLVLPFARPPFIAPLLFDTVVTAMTVWKAFTIRRHNGGPNSRLIQTFLREGIFYYILISIANLINGIFYLQPRQVISAINIPLSVMMGPVLACRLILDLRERGSETVSHSEGGIAAFTTKSMSQQQCSPFSPTHNKKNGTYGRRTRGGNTINSNIMLSTLGSLHHDVDLDLDLEQDLSEIEDIRRGMGSAIGMDLGSLSTAVGGDDGEPIPEGDISYLDLPDLAALAQVSPVLASLASDPLLHNTRVRITAPSRVKHALFGVNPRGVALRPTVGDLVHRGVIRGFAIERRWRMGAYFYSRNSIVQYENGLRLARRHASDVISVQLRRRLTRDKFLDSISHVLPDVESASYTISRILLPAIHQLKWSLQRDKFAKVLRLGFCATALDGANFGDWRERRDHSIIEDGERVRLAICPDIRKTVRFYEELARALSSFLLRKFLEDNMDLDQSDHRDEWLKLFGPSSDGIFILCYLPMTTPNIPNAGLGLDFLRNHHGDILPNDNAQDVSAPFRREPSTSAFSNSTPLHLIVDSPCKYRSITPLGSSDSGTEIRQLDSSLQGDVDASSRPISTLVRHGTLLSANAAPQRNAAELNSILGDSTARLKPGASLLPIPGQTIPEECTSLEQAKSRARVEVDIVLDSNTSVQGGYLQGRVKIHIHGWTRNETPVRISEGKVRVIGFESISNERDRYPFYQCSSRLSTVTATSGGLHDSHRDSEGFAQAIEGEHILPFSMYLPMSADYGAPKGSIKVQAGVAVRYIAMVSIKVKDSVSGSRSIAHFYRDCEIWPRLNPSIILIPASTPLRAKTSYSRIPGSRKIHLAASVHRLHWVAGQQCFVKVFVANESQKSIKSLVLTLVRTTVVFKPNQRADTLEGVQNQLDLDTCTISTTQKQVAESILELGQRGTRGHASAKGWWAGVAPGKQLEFSHSIMLPPDALSVIRSRLIEVDYSIKITLSAGGTLRTTDVEVLLPIQIINFLSIDPPPSYPLPEAFSSTYPSNPDSPNGHSMGTIDTGLHRTSNVSVLESLTETDEERLPSPRQVLDGTAESPELCDDLGPTDAYDGIDYNLDDEDSPGCVRRDVYFNLNENLEDLTIYEDDADEVVPHILQADPECENAPRFADLYYASVEESLCHPYCLDPRDVLQNSAASPFQYQADLVRRVQEYSSLPSGLRPNYRPPMSWRPNLPKSKRPSSFAGRVQAKLSAAAQDSSASQTPYSSHLQHSMAGSSWSQSYTHASVTTTSNALDGYDRGALVTLPISESTSSLPYTNSAFLNVYGDNSRLLPKPPTSTHIHSAGPLEPTKAAISSQTYTTPSTSIPASVIYHAASAASSQYQVQAPISKINSNHHTSVDARPSLTMSREQTGGSLIGSTNTVKERIKELEERQRLLDLTGP